MGKVARLEPDVFRKIAAGEVIERPLSVVKELVENALDAGASRISVRLEDAGKRLIEVEDDGEGFCVEDIPLAFEHHATSKIRQLDDFDRLWTFGFRGEALPSIREVARLHLATASGTQGQGWQVRWDEGRVVEEGPVARPRGTTLRVEDLFYNLPVRRKFLKSDRTEVAQVSGFLEQMAMAFPQVTWLMQHQGRTLMRLGAVPTLQERLFQIWGGDVLEQLLPLSWEVGPCRLEGFASRPGTGVGAKNRQFFFVNSRSVREQTLVGALNRAYEPYLEKFRNPVAVLLLQVPPAEVDVNIHPMKREIKFRDGGLIFSLIKGGVDQLARDASQGEALEPSATPPGLSGQGDDFPLPVFRQAEPRLFGWEPSEASRGFVQPEPSDPPSLMIGEGVPVSGTAGRTGRDYQLLGQWLDSYILIQRGEELWVVDQHNAHERARYERLLRQYRAGRVAAVQPLFPMVWELSPAEWQAWDPAGKGGRALEPFGFQLEVFGERTVRVRAYPELVPAEEVIRTLAKLLESISRGDLPEGPEGPVLAEVACKGAIKVNTPLKAEEMLAVVDGLLACENPWHCPHRRPIVVRLGRMEIEKRLGRR